MPTNRKRRGRGSALDKTDRAVLLLGTGMNHWRPGEREYYRRLWVEHGRRMIEEAEASGQPRPMAEMEFGEPENHQ